MSDNEYLEVPEVQRIWRNVVTIAPYGYGVFEIAEVMGQPDGRVTKYMTECADGTWIVRTFYFCYTQEHLDSVLSDENAYFDREFITIT